MKSGIGRFQRSSGSLGALASFVLVLGAFMAIYPGPVSGQQSDGLVTFTRDVAPILQDKCQTCHRDGSIAPMPLTTFEEVRPFARRIREKVASRTMPPWPLDHTIGIQEFKNDVSLSDGEIQTILSWVDSGALMGDSADMPPLIEWAAFENDWQYAERFGRPPDITLASPGTSCRRTSWIIGPTWRWRCRA